MPKIYVLVGVPGAGKTTYANSKLKDAAYIGTDRIRYEFFGKEMTIRGYRKVRKEMIHRVIKYVGSGYDVVVDCTNLTLRRRQALLKHLPAGSIPIAIYLKTRLITALRNNAARDRHVPVPGIIYLYMRQVPPRKSEGFHQIITVTEKIQD